MWVNSRQMGWSRSTDSSKDGLYFLSSRCTLVDLETLKSLQNILYQCFNCSIKFVYKLPDKGDWTTRNCFYLQEECILHLSLAALASCGTLLWGCCTEGIHWKGVFASQAIFHHTEQAALGGVWCIAGIWTEISSCLMRTVLEQQITPGRITFCRKY